MSERLKRLATVLALALLPIVCVSIASSHARAADALKKLVLFGQPSVNNDSVWMAIANGYYKAEGLDVEYRVFPSGTTAFQTFKTGQGDIVMTGDLPSVQYFFNNPGQYKTIAVIERDSIRSTMMRKTRSNANPRRQMVRSATKIRLVWSSIDEFCSR